MPDPNHLNEATKLGDYGSFLGGVTAIVGSAIAAIKTFPTKGFIKDNYVKKVESDGSRAYVHPTEFQEVKADVKAARILAQETNDLIKTWINKP